MFKIVGFAVLELPSLELLLMELPLMELPLTELLLFRCCEMKKRIAHLEMPLVATNNA